MPEVLALLEEIREGLRLLYKKLVEKLVPIEEALDDEREAVEAGDEVVGEEEVVKVLGL